MRTSRDTQPLSVAVFSCCLYLQTQPRDRRSPLLIAVLTISKKMKKFLLAHFFFFAMSKGRAFKRSAMSKGRAFKRSFELLGDPLSSVTRATKKSLFVFSSLCILIGFTGVAPDEAIVLGFKFPGLTQSVINLSLLALAIYSYLNFVLHLVSDFLRYRIASDRYNLARASDMIGSMVPPDDKQDYHDSEFRRETGYIEKNVPHWATSLIIRLKLGFDFLFPLGFVCQRDGPLNDLYFSAPVASF